MTFIFKHPKYYKELRKAGNELAKRNAVKEDLACSGSSPARNKSDQAISDEAATAATSVRPGPGLRSYPLSGNGGKLDSLQTLADKAQATSHKPQAPSIKHQASTKKNNRRQAPSNKHQASSHKQQAPRFLNHGTCEND